MDHPLTQYDVLKHEGHDGQPESSFPDSLEGYDYLPRGRARGLQAFYRIMIPVTLFISLLLNAILVWRLNTQPQHDNQSLYGKK